MTKHFGTARHTGVDAPEWLPVGSAIAELVNKWAKRDDLITRVGPNESAHAPALFNPAAAEVEVNTTTAFGAATTPVQVGDLRDAGVRYDWPKAVGAIYHEACHARFSRFDLAASARDLPPRQNEALHLLEEGRIEGLGVRHEPGMRLFLRACALEIVLADLSAEKLAETTAVRQLATTAALTLGRVDAGVLRGDDVLAVTRVLEAQLGTELLDQLRSVWTRFQAHVDHDSSLELYPLAIEWDQLLADAEKDRGDDEGGDPSNPGGTGGTLQDLIDALGEDAAEAMIAVADALADQQQTEEWRDESAKRADAATETRRKLDQAGKVFSKSSGPGEARTSSKLLEKRQPTGPERAAAVKVAKLLEKAKYHDRDTTEVTSQLPPGRLRTGAMVQAAALKAKGVRSQVEPWRRTARKRTDDTTLKVGVMVDISGSMGRAMQPMAVTAWVMSEAVRRVQGKAAMVYYGNDVFPTLKPGQHLDEVAVYSAMDGTEKFGKAFDAVDGALGLTTGSGARLLVVVSDAAYMADEVTKAQAAARQCLQSGCAVLWITFDRGNEVQTNITRVVPGVEVIANAGDPVEVAATIGEAAARALTRAGTSR